jgi:alkyl hydroperoxide reductase subunit AhpF
MMALENPHIRAEAIDAASFPDAANAYEVYAVPRTVINEVIRFDGAVPEPALLTQLLEAQQHG